MAGHRSPARRQGRTIVQDFLLGLLRLLMKLLLQTTTTGLENVPPDGPVIFVINHIAWLDPVAALGILPRRTIPMAKEEVFRYFVVGWLVRLYGVIPVRRGEADVPAIKRALQILRAGGAVLLAPEGTRSPTGCLQPGKDGAATLALRGPAPIVPVGVTGTRGIHRAWLKLRRPAIHFSIGPAFWLTPPAGERPLSRTHLPGLTRQVMTRLAAQLPEEMRGVYR